VAPCFGRGPPKFTDVWKGDRSRQGRGEVWFNRREKKKCCGKEGIPWGGGGRKRGGAMGWPSKKRKSSVAKTKAGKMGFGKKKPRRRRGGGGRACFQVARKETANPLANAKGEKRKQWVLFPGRTRRCASPGHVEKEQQNILIEKEKERDKRVPWWEKKGKGPDCVIT